MNEGDRWETVSAIARRLPGVGATKVREYADAGLLRTIRLPSGHRRISVASADALSRVLKMDPGPERDAEMDELRRRNRSSDTTDG